LADFRLDMGVEVSDSIDNVGFGMGLGMWCVF
jgi:hypothetical protein